MEVEVPHFKYPMELDPATGDFAMVEQYTSQEVAQNVAIILRTPPGWRQLIPRLGLADPRFDMLQDPPVAEIAQQIDEFEPRAEEIVEEDPAALDVVLAQAGVRVAVGAR